MIVLMRRVLQFGTLLLLLVMLLAPLAEYFDSWDPPGISNDREFAAFALVFALCLVLAVCMLLAARSLLGEPASEWIISDPSGERLPLAPELVVSVFIPPRLLPLRI